MARPIGTIFKHVSPPSNIGMMNYGLKNAGGTTGKSGSHFTVREYKIIGHANDGQLESVEMISGPEYFLPKRWEIFRGNISPVPPDELLGFFGPDWQQPMTYLTYVEVSA